jgi:DnaJ-class molecular chaperone
MNTQDYYRVLGVDQNVDAQKIKEAYRKLAYEYHPDRNQGDPQALEKMKWVNEAYAVLSNPAKRREYDTLRRQFGDSAHSHFRKSYSDQDIFRGSDIHAVFEEMTRAFGFRGVDDVFREFYGSGYRSFEFRKPGFFARGFVYTGARKKGQIPGDESFQRKPIGNFTRFLFNKISGITLPAQGADIHDAINIDPQLALSGGPYAYLMRRKNKKLVVKIPPGVRKGQRIRLAGMGQDGRNGGQPGDLYLKVHIRKPLLETVKDFFTGLLD